MDIMESEQEIKIYTSYFSRYKGDNGISIALGAPWWKGERYKDLAPTNELLQFFKNCGHGRENQTLYENIYRKTVLAKLDVHKVARDLNGKVLLCFEGPASFCHRHIVCKWLKENGYRCEEI